MATGSTLSSTGDSTSKYLHSTQIVEKKHLQDIAINLKVLKNSEVLEKVKTEVSVGHHPPHSPKRRELWDISIRNHALDCSVDALLKQM